MHDIPYLKFHAFSLEIKDHAADHIFIADKVIEHFYPGVTDNEALYVEEFSIALNTDSNRFIPYRLSFKQLLKADKFIDADTFKNENDMESLLKMLVKSLVTFRKVDVNNISLSDGNKILLSFRREYSKLSNLFNIFLTRQLRLQFQR